jgi:antitoxin component YwqK of YwqJK toxin-antitoxin module
MRVLIMPFLVFLASCSPPEVPAEKLVERRGVTYLINSQTPFSGLSVSYYESGQWKVKSNYRDGMLDGLVEHYHENGALLGKGSYKGGKPHGLWEYYYKDGVLKEKGSFKNGKPHGTWQTYDETGHLKTEDVYKDSTRK